MPRAERKPTQTRHMSLHVDIQDDASPYLLNGLGLSESLGGGKYSMLKSSS
jgi:hypothetical protein